MGKRSRKRGGLDVAERPLPPRDEQAALPEQARPRGTRPPKRSQYADQPATSFMGRVAESWQLAGERPAKQVPKAERVRERPERPQGIFGPVPVSEIMLLAGFAGLIIGLARGPEEGSTAITVSVLVIGLASLELAAREHFSGFRPRTLFLATVTTVALHAAVSLGIGGGISKNPVLIVIDAVVFATLLWTLGDRYKRARRELRGGAQ